MKHSFLDQYSDGNSFIHKLDPRTKFIGTILFILALYLTPPGKWLAFAVYFGLMATLIVVSRVPVSYVLKRSLVIIPFVLVIAVFIPFFKEGEVLWSYSLGRWLVSVTDNGVQAMGNILAKAWLSILGLILLSATTRMTSLLQAWEQLRFPRVMTLILSFMYRYIFVLTDEVLRMKQARDSRNFGGNRLRHIRTVGNMTGTLFLRSYERGERVYAAMLARGFDGRSRTLDRLSFQLTDIYFSVVFGLVLIATSIFSIWH